MVNVNLKRFSRGKYEEENKEEIKQEEIKQEEIKQEEIKQEEIKQEEIKPKKGRKKKEIEIIEEENKNEDLTKINDELDELDELNNINYGKPKQVEIIEEEIKSLKKSNDFSPEAYAILNKVKNKISNNNLSLTTRKSIKVKNDDDERFGFSKENLKPNSSKNSKVFDDEPTEILGKDKRILLSKIQQYKSLFPEVLSKFKIKKNPSIEDLQEVLGEMEIIVNCDSVENFLNDSILQCIKIIEGASTYTKYDVSGMSEILRNNKQFNELSKMLYVKYNVFNRIPPEYQLMMLMATTAYICVEKNKRKESLKAYLNETSPSGLITPKAKEAFDETVNNN